MTVSRRRRHHALETDQRVDAERRDLAPLDEDGIVAGPSPRLQPRKRKFGPQPQLPGGQPAGLRNSSAVRQLSDRSDDGLSMSRPGERRDPYSVSYRFERRSRGLPQQSAPGVMGPGVRRGDGVGVETQLRDLAAPFARALPVISLPSDQRAQGMPGVRCTRSLVCKEMARTFRAAECFNPIAVVMRAEALSRKEGRGRSRVQSHW